MWWMIATGVVAFLIILYVIGKQAIARDDEIDAKDQRARGDGLLTPNLTAEKPLVSQRPDRFVEEQDVVFYANTFHGYFTNDGLDTLLSVMQTRELSLNTMCEALTAIGAQPIVPLLEQASLESERHARESDALAAQTGSGEQQTQVKAYLERMRELETAIDKLEVDVDQLSKAYARRHGTD